MVRNLCFCLILWLSISSVIAEEFAEVIRQMERVKANQVDYLIALEDGKDRSTLCGYCHGKDGNSVKPEIPNLAGQNPEYLLKQFQLFANGERKNYVMERLAKSISTKDQIDMVFYFSSQQVLSKSDGESSEHGQSIYQGLCVACHGSNGLGNKELPRLAGQNKEFLVKAMNDFKKGKSTRPNSPMIEIMKGVKPSDIDHLARYISSM